MSFGSGRFHRFVKSMGLARAWEPCGFVVLFAYGKLARSGVQAAEFAQHALPVAITASDAWKRQDIHGARPFLPARFPFLLWISC